MKTIEAEQSLGIQFCRRQALAVERGAGVWVWDEQGRRYLDMTAGWGVTSLGHCHPVVQQALQQQSGLLMQSPNSGFTYSTARGKLLQTLARSLPEGLTRSYFVNSGAEANDAAIKLARKITGRSKLIATNFAFHGRTYATLNATSGIETGKQFPPANSHTTFVPYGDITAMAKEIDGQTAAVILEPIQGEGGVRVPPANYIAQVSALCVAAGAKFIVDEVQTGFCRTGKFFAVAHDSDPMHIDFLTMGKGIGGGYPFAGFAVNDAVNQQLHLGDHGGTYAGNPLGCAVANAVVSYMQQHDIANRVQNLGSWLLEEVSAFAGVFPDLVTEVRGKGLLIALQMHNDEQVRSLTDTCLALGMLVTPTRNGVVRLLPSLLITQEEAQQAVSLLRSGLQLLHSTGVGSCDRLQRSIAV